VCFAAAYTAGERRAARPTLPRWHDGWLWIKLLGEKDRLTPPRQFLPMEISMHRPGVALAALTMLAMPSALRADAFDNYTNEVLVKAPRATGVLALKQLTPGVMSEHGGVLPGTTAALLVVRTNEGRLSKLLVQPARQKLQDKATVPILLIERYVTYKEGEERTVIAEGHNVRLFDGFQFNLDLGQVVPVAVGGDLRFVAAAGKVMLEPVAKAEMYLVTKPLPDAAPKKSARVVVGDKFEPRLFNGVYKLHDDGRRSGTLHLKVLPGGDIEGSYYSDKDGQKYEVNGKIGISPQAIEFVIVFPRTRQQFTGWMFTGDARAIAGYTRLQDRDTGFYALRLEDQ
jgi:hypothetical protein